jgi:hypothetical protein
MGIIKRIGVATASVIGVGVLTFAPHTAQAAPAPAPAAAPAPEVPFAPQHGDYQNGCTLSPDSGWYTGVYYNFHSACDWHDLCYHYHYYGGGYDGRKACDDGFRSRMRSWCYSRYDSWWEYPARLNCYTVAQIYYEAVRSAGWAFF